MHFPQTDIEKTAFKMRLLQKCTNIIEQRIAAIAAAIANAQAAANAEEKSSAGDKYETARAMGHLEKDMQSRQLAANQKELAALSGVDCSVIHPSVAKGSFIRCTQHAFFIAAGLGKIIFEENTVWLLSPDASLAKLIYNKKQGEVIPFNKTQQLIEAVF